MRHYWYILVFCMAAAFCACRKETRIEKIVDPGYYGRIKFVLEDYEGTRLFNGFMKQQVPALADSLATPAEYTVMVPDNNAFNALMTYTLATDTPQVQRLLRFPYYIVKGKTTLKGLPLGLNQELTAINGNKLWVSKWKKGGDTVISVNGSFVSVTDGAATNGYINVLTKAYNGIYGNRVIDVINSEYNLSLFAAALQYTHLDDTLRLQDLYTVIAPDNEAFRLAGYPSLQGLLQMNKDSLTDLLRYHILPGRKFLSDIEMELSPAQDTSRYKALNGMTVRSFMAPSFMDLFPNSLRVIFLGDHNEYYPYGLFANNAYLTTFVAANGVVHTSKLVLK